MTAKEKSKLDNPKASDADVEKIDDKAGIHSIDSARHLERAQKKEYNVVEGNEAGSCKIEHKDN